MKKQTNSPRKQPKVPAKAPSAVVTPLFRGDGHLIPGMRIAVSGTGMGGVWVYVGEQHCGDTDGAIIARDRTAREWYWVDASRCQAMEVAA